MRKVCIVGLDGVNYQIIRLLSNALQLSNVTDILCKGIIFSPISIPPYTPTAWTSIFTGVNPGKHGIYGFYNVQKFRDTFKIRLSNSYTVKYPRIFEMLAMYKAKSIVINAPLTYPVQGVIGHSNMVIVSDWASPRQFIYPKHYETKFQHYLSTPPHSWWACADDEYYRFVSKYSEVRTNLYLELLEEDFQLFIVIISELDWLFHRYPRTLVGEGLDKLYKVASLINNLFKKLREVCDLIIVVSDHGFEIAHYVFNINMLLALKGLTSYEYLPAPSKILRLFSIKPTQSTIQRLSQRKSLTKHRMLDHIAKASARMLKKIMPLYIVNTHSKYIPIHVAMNFSNSKAFMIECESWSLYVEDKYLNTTVNLAKRSGLIKELLVKHELFWGPYTNTAPEAIIVPHNGIAYGATLQGKIIDHKVLGHHTIDALLIFYGDDIHSDSLRSNITLFDIVPTVLAYMELPIPHNSDGKILSEILSMDLRNVRKTDYVQRFKMIRKTSKVYART